MKALAYHEWADQQGSRYLEPDPTPVQNPMDTKRRTWSRTHAMACPWCGQRFYGWEPVDAPFQPMANPGLSRHCSLGQRATCGHPLCESAELGYCRERIKAHAPQPGGLWGGRK